MKQFLFIFRGGVFVEKGVSAQETQSHLEKWGKWSESMIKSGHMEGGNPLKQEGRTIRGSKKAVTDAPFAEAKDLLTGYILIKAKNLAEATELAMDCPIYLHDGSLEIREVREMER